MGKRIKVVAYFNSEPDDFDDDGELTEASHQDIIGSQIRYADDWDISVVDEDEEASDG